MGQLACEGGLPLMNPTALDGQALAVIAYLILRRYVVLCRLLFPAALHALQIATAVL